MLPTIAIPWTGADPRYLFREGLKPTQRGLPEAGSEERESTGSEEAILCRACRTRITSAREAIAVSGIHIHTFFNPAGIVFEISCFRRASGCLVHGAPTSEFSWFTGSRWQYAVCGTCQKHVGWYFTLPAETFFGLIRNRLIIPMG